MIFMARARAAHCRATQSIFAHISDWNRAAMAVRLLDTRKKGSNFADKLWQTGKCFFQLFVCGSAAMLLKPWCGILSATK